MYLVPRDSMPDRLAPAWAFLSGDERHFEEQPAHACRPGQRELAVVLPVHLHNGRPHRLMAVGLVIDEREARHLACFMMGLAEDQVNEDDVRDVCMEACNVLGGSLVDSSHDGHVAEVGLPHPLSPDRFADLLRQAPACITFSCEGLHDRRVLVTVFDAVDEHILES